MMAALEAFRNEVRGRKFEKDMLGLCGARVRVTEHARSPPSGFSVYAFFFFFCACVHVRLCVACAMPLYTWRNRYYLYDWSPCFELFLPTLDGAEFARAGFTKRDALGGKLDQAKDLSSLFCSELVSESFMRMGLLLSETEVRGQRV
jgi:hypothetical protein